MTRVRLAAAAVEDLHELILTHELPPDTPGRVVRRLRMLGRFPEMGRALGGRWDGARYLLGPWSWFVIVYDYDRNADTATVLTMQDGRRAASPTSE